MRVDHSHHRPHVTPVDHSAHDGGKLHAKQTENEDAQHSQQAEYERQNQINNRIRDNLDHHPVNQHVRTGQQAMEKQIQQPGGR